MGSPLFAVPKPAPEWLASRTTNTHMLVEEVVASFRPALKGVRGRPRTS